MMRVERIQKFRIASGRSNCKSPQKKEKVQSFRSVKL
jgi:hypothetical protein